VNRNQTASFGYALFTDTIDEQIELAIEADQLGFAAMTFGEHIVLPWDVPNVYMPSKGAEITDTVGLPRSVYDENIKFFDIMALMGATARETKRISLISAVYLASLRHPLMTVHSMATLDELSNGRFMLGVGAGWNKAEFEALGANFEERGSILDETLDILKLAMHGGPIEHSGRHYSFKSVQVSKRSMSVPILVGGHSAPALRRAARCGDGWMSSLANDLDELVQFTKRIDALRQEMGTADRPFQHWIKLTSIDPPEIEELQRKGINRFQLIGEQIWGPRDAHVSVRRDRMRSAAAALKLD
jgi:probable F420-dependent oxidoreductase